MQKIIKWNPFPNEKNQRIYCEGVHDDYEGFRILLTGEEKASPMLRLSLENTLYYQNRDEGYFFNYGNIQGAFDYPHPFYIIEYSELIQKFHIESENTFSELNIKHYAIYTCNDCIDILSEKEPKAVNLSD